MTCTISRRTLMCALFGAAALPKAIWAQPSRTARIVVPFPAGGGTDATARLLAEKMKEQYPAGIIVDNRVGASGRIGAEFVKNSAPDGLTMLFATDFMMTVYPHSFKALGYDPLKDFVPVAQCGSSSYALVAGPGLPASVRNFADLARWCKANPKSASFGSTSAGSPSHFMGALLSQEIGVELLHVPYKGGAQALQAVMGGEVPFIINPVSEALPFVQANRVRVLATTGSKRTPQLADVQTLTEAGVKDGVIEFWLGAFLPAATPAAIVARTAENFSRALQTPEVGALFAATSKELTLRTPTEFASVIRAETLRWKELVAKSKFVAEE